MKIVVLDGYTTNPGDLSWSKFEELADITVYERTPLEMVAARIGDADGVITNDCHISNEVMDQCQNLKWIGVISTGVNILDLDHATDRGILVANVPAYSTDSVAQLTISLLLEICNHVKTHSDAVSAGKWSRSQDFSFTLTPQIELAGKTFGIVGFGNISRRVAKIVEALGMNVVISTNHPDNTFSNEQIRFGSLDEVLSHSNVISLHCPLNDSNREMINQETISKMKDNVILLNTARGGLINEQDLAQALRSKKIFAAGLDVLSTEPPPENHPLIGLENCFITPHMGWITKEARIRLLDTALENLKSYLRGGFLNCLNPKAVMGKK
jgi:glycerate dehydrogenase